MVRATKKITASGDSLVVNVTKEVKMMGLERGDFVVIDLEKPEGEKISSGGIGKCIDCLYYSKKVWDLGSCSYCNFPGHDGEIFGPIDIMDYCRYYAPKNND